MHELDAWLQRQAARERSIVRLEDALLAGRWSAYFVRRLRFFMARGVLSTLFHALKVVLLLGIFPRAEFVVIIVLQAAVAVVGDGWWGALEAMRSRVRLLQRRGKGHLVFREIGGWLRLSAWLTTAGALGAAALLVVMAVVDGSLSAAELYAAFLVATASIELTVRAYHSGAYALRRVYRPLPSFLAVDAVQLAALVCLWPLAGIWAFPVAELLSGLTVAAVSLHYTSRAYRALALPTLVPLLRQRFPAPSRTALRSALLPAIAYGLVGVDALVVIAALMQPDRAGSFVLVVLLAALGPVVRMGFEWARLAYFDLKRLELPLLRGMRQRFDRAMAVLALVMGAGTWLVAAFAGVALLGIRQLDVVLALAPLLVLRSLLAAAQMRAFTRMAYRRLALVGSLGAVGVLVALAGVDGTAPRILAISAVLGLSMLLLLSLGEPPEPADAIVSLPDWLARLRNVRGPVAVSSLAFDDRVSARGVTVEARRAEAWRRRVIAARIGQAVARRGGSVAWSSRTELHVFEPTRHGQPIRDPAIGRDDSGLVRRASPEVVHPRGAEAAAATVGSLLGPESRGTLASVETLVAEFRRRFPRGEVLNPAGPTTAGVAARSSNERAEIYRAALVFCRDLRSAPRPRGTEVTALALHGSLELMFLVRRREGAAARRAWQRTVRAWTLRAVVAGAPAQHHERATFKDAAAPVEGGP